VLGAHDREDWAENLFLVDFHVGGHLVEQAAADEIAVLVTLEFEVSAVDDKLGALFDAAIDIAAPLVEELARDHRSVIDLRVAGGSDLEAFDAGNELLHERVGGLAADRHRDRNGHAALAG